MVIIDEVSEQRKNELIRLAKEKHQTNVTEITQSMTLGESLVFISEVERLDLELKIKNTADKLNLDMAMAELLIRSKRAHEYLAENVSGVGSSGTCAAVMVEELGQCIKEIEGECR